MWRIKGIFITFDNHITFISSLSGLDIELPEIYSDPEEAIKAAIKHLVDNNFNKIIMWVARDKDGYLCAYESIPHRGSNEWSSTNKYKVNETVYVELGTIPINNELFPELKWEDEPIEVEIIKRKRMI